MASATYDQRATVMNTSGFVSRIIAEAEGYGVIDGSSGNTPVGLGAMKRHIGARTTGPCDKRGELASRRLARLLELLDEAETDPDGIGLNPNRMLLQACECYVRRYR